MVRRSERTNFRARLASRRPLPSRDRLPREARRSRKGVAPLGAPASLPAHKLRCLGNSRSSTTTRKRRAEPVLTGLRSLRPEGSREHSPELTAGGRCPGSTALAGTVAGDRSREGRAGCPGPISGAGVSPSDFHAARSWPFQTTPVGGCKPTTAMDLARCLEDLVRMRILLPRLERTGSSVDCSPAPQRPFPLWQQGRR
jgi:hypothetical protein